MLDRRAAAELAIGRATTNGKAAIGITAMKWLASLSRL